MPTHLLEFVHDLLQIELLPQLHIIADQIRLVVDEQVEKVPHAHVAERDVTLLRDQERDHVDVVATGGQQQWRAHLIVQGVDVGAHVQQEGGHRDVVRDGCLVQRSLAGRVP